MIFFNSSDNVIESPIALAEPNLLTTEPVAASSLVNGFHLQGAKSTQSRCFICHSKSGRKAVPWPAIQQSWFEMRCYVPKTNRTCDDHLTNSHTFNDEALQMIKTLKQDISVETKEFELWLDAVSNLQKSTPYNFEEDGIEAEKYRMFLGIEKDSFDDLLQYLQGNF